jgi:superfamily II DNA or RNA helicase
MLRPYQNDALTAIKTNYEKGISRQVVAMATGTGKTQCFAHLPDYIPGQTLVLAHREELIDQAIHKLHTINPTLKISKEMAAEWADGKSDIIVASVASLGRKNTDRAKRFPWDNIKTIITDECHHSTSTSYKNIYEMADVLRPDSGKLHVGFTATPQRSDNKGLSEIYDKIVYTYDIRKAIEDNWLVEVKGIRVHTQTSLDDVSTQAGDFNQTELAQTVNTPARNKLIVKTWIEQAKGRRTMVFTVDIAHAQDLAKTFQEAGVTCAAVWGDDPERAAKTAAHRSGELDVIINCGVFTEGYDDPEISCIILARPTKSRILFTQCIGRGTRLFIGKIDCLVIDVVDSTSRHNLIMLPSLLGMSSQLDLKGKGLVEAISQIEKQQELYPHIDFSSLKDIDALESYIEEVNLWEPKIPAEIDAHTEMIWHPAATGGYVMMLPEKDEIRITQNLLDKWELHGKLKGKKYKGERDSLDAVFSAADDLVKNVAPDVLKLVQRDAEWHKLEPTSGQLKALKRIYKKKPIPYNMTRGWASKLIGAGKAKKG